MLDKPPWICAPSICYLSKANVELGGDVGIKLRTRHPL